ncbi:bifunctional phosphopantothenoylcysteine decarboxylase/phosphopantothenate--cysteine ligase CoaBC [Soehngenia longivitae]|uniref:Coenzyme A biosynthesis bifunctional protein CoaBC n=1 Tax=Soehngenia longivitae TaxID=2562294 RepID=A0A4Z0D4X1_9FIRM|nr:bifunctional phosphopantothenoylcysteine decarboxylase/phosphopantothenate--cysteine ligase CoaBC [Soehngenia longivitae]TFZ39569.1 bifunctional phosphopantothenoylcysteine decarboxylase/phosphopantothenate--cysteine ligase CoaBC [Soehngenia longivitae]
MLDNKNIIVGVTGGIAIYKTLDLISKLKKENANIEVIVTKAATEFITPLTFQTMSQNKVHFDMFGLVNEMEIEHISLAKKADVILVAPATANTLGKIANGIADNLLTTVIMATNKKVVFAPAMNTQMYKNPIVQNNIIKLKELGYEFINPGEGRLACGDEGTGKMAEPIQIIEYLKNLFTEKDLIGKKIIVTAGPTQEAIDPVRYITNRSSGKMGYAIAKEASRRGADVILIAGPTDLEVPDGVKFERIITTQEMLEKINLYFDDADVLVKAAAPSDYKPTHFSDKKIKKETGIDKLEIDFEKNPDIAAYFGARKKNNQLIVGFAAETDDLYENATKKIQSKNLDFIVANDVTMEGAGFEVDTNIVSIIYKDGTIENLPIMEKSELAKIIIDKIKNILE